MKRNIGASCGSIVLLMGLLCAGCASEGDERQEQPAPSFSAANQAEVADAEFVEDRYLYAQDQGDRLFHLYVTVLKSGQSKGEDRKLYTFNDINHIFSRMPDGQDDPELEVLLQEGTAEGPAEGFFGYGENEANATIQIRGSSTRGTDQKSYKIKLFDKAGLWKEQKVLNLNKHALDLTRVRNKLSFDLFKSIPGFSSLRTHFVSLHVKDLTADKPAHTFVDYGLYTEIENPGKMFLKTHGLDANGQLYKANEFTFYRYPQAIREKSDPAYSKKEFEKILKIEGSEDHAKLIAMLDDVNDENLNINDIVAKHFDRDNMLTWLAVNILTGDLDTIDQNYMLYSPINSSVWYFMPWDYDGAWDWYNQPGMNVKPSSWQSGIANYWSNVLFKRFFMDPDNVKALNEKIESLTPYINAERVNRLLDTYRELVSTHVHRPPDLWMLPADVGNFETEYKRLAEVPEKNKESYYQNLEKPMPVFLGEPQPEESQLSFNWDASYDLQGDDLRYDFQIAAKPDFSNIVFEKTGLTGTKILVDKLAKGDYYWRVVIYDSKGNRQIPFDRYEDSEGNIHYGMKEYKVR